MDLRIVYILFIWNVVVLAMYGIDKAKSVKGSWRISEKTLLICAALFGSFGAFFGMQLFHHKTLHKKFSIGVPLMMILHAALLIWFCIR